MSEALFPTRWKKDKPPSLERFMATFPDDYACADHLARKRWPNGFRCPHCASQKGWKLESRPWVFQCSGKGENPGCRKQTSVIAKTVMHGTHLPLRTWFIAAYLVATHSNSISALQLQPKIGVGSYKTAWLLLHKLRRAMVDPGRSPLEGKVEIDETSFPHRKRTESPDGGQGKSTVGKVFVIGAVEHRDGRKSGRLRLAKIAEDRREFMVPFVLANTAKGCTMVTDGSSSYVGIPDRGHILKNLSKDNAPPGHIAMERIHRAFSNLKRWSLGTFHGFREKHVDAYLNEFVFRWNRRRSFQTTMERILGIGQALPRTTYRDIVGDTSEWRRQHQAQIFKMTSPLRMKMARELAREMRIPIIEALAQIRTETDKRYERRQPKRPALALRREGDARLSGRYRYVARPTVAAIEARYPKVVPEPKVAAH
ncbi:hypothetical protein Sa4125_35040 [Aureimonas sp. SA4125]|nr:hypothetical protein Sa4125_09020 [Aureimonas sp. SA4125]BDA83439.1 hypothetical protein Sa4125_09810 [Aureimonas sp. SA4125]BDA83738.1 hypothetical protein Sa4125_12800 [Aureimonas sp. SA4125]BDA84592.1 hypothetical protein Sa4125_21340 [Aureimonas sp. SA4125]BDA85962.1 hypothetical protein Sa4125_35040 [Aureimonas sp. SA4125]